METSAKHSTAPPDTDRRPPEARTSGAAALVQGCNSLPSLPAAYLRLVEAMNDPYSSAEDFAAIVERDPGLTARVLRIVNSPLYRLSAPVETVSTAMSVLGVGQLHDLVLATSAIEVFNHLPSDLMNMEAFWKHSLATAVVSRAIGEAVGHRDVDKLFVMGLLHDVGRLVLCLVEPNLIGDLLARACRTGELLVEMERDELGFDHASIGRELLMHWRLPLTLTEPVGSHHEPENGHVFQQEAAILHVADVTAHALFFESNVEPLIPPVSAHAWAMVEGDWSAQQMFKDVHIQFQVAQQVILH